ncbi:Bifunctional purine biosynthetic protein ADE5,7 [Polyrhizophydium stewartii]|uniref:phosphoribosylglycinamide formyltransferase 1 n=1 Tax=Polyrhizophydium stewartii TaxID=2732419 RepID=A0ABR4N9V9_9FUNG|nr:hypothetical protein HK105_006001 [Polyrhizophydium stewartii]
MPAAPRLVVLISGNGSNLQAIIDATRADRIGAQVALVVSNRRGVFGLERAATAGIPTLVKTLKPYRDQGKTRVDYDVDLAVEIKARLAELAAADPASVPLGADPSQPDLIVLAGFMHILSAEFLAGFADGRVINLHPALPGAFDGAHAIERAFDSFQRGEIANTGVMVHKVIPQVDRGEVVVKREVPILKTDTLATLEERMHSVEHELIVEGVRAMLTA